MEPAFPVGFTTEVETQKRAANFSSRGGKNSLKSAIFLDDSFRVPT
jgi:hypothetical protein